MRIAAIIMGMIGLFFLGLGAYLFVGEQLFLQRAEPASAVVKENKLYKYTGQVNEYGVQHYYCSEFQFQTKDGRSVPFEEPHCAELDSPPDYQIGQQVDIYYDPRDPGNTAQMRDSAFANTIAATVTGVASLLLGLGLFWIGFLRGMRAAGSRLGRQ